MLMASVTELREAYLAAVKSRDRAKQQIFYLALLERLEALSAAIGSDPRDAKVDPGEPEGH